MEKTKSAGCSTAEGCEIAPQPDYVEPQTDQQPATARKSCRPGRRTFLCGAVTIGLNLPLIHSTLADEEKPGADERPQIGDLFVFAEGDNEGEVIKPGDIPLDGPQILAWPMDPKEKVVRDGSRLNQVLLLRLDPASIGDDAKPHSADGVIAYSAICSHAGCPVTGWVDDQGTQVLKCFCHNSEYDPRRNAEVVFGPATRRLAALPIKLVDGTLTVAGKFIGRVVPQQQG
jgi:Rieske Fe-S protein